MSANFRAFGKEFHLETGGDRFLENDSLWRLRVIYEPFLAATSLPLAGVAVDAGAGFGAFALPFASIFKGWKIWCFEPDNNAFSALCRNILKLGLNNLVAVNAAIGRPLYPLPKALERAAMAQNPAAMQAAARPASYFRHRQKPGFIEAGTAPEFQSRFRPVTLAELPANALSLLCPDFLKLTAPGNEAAILGALATKLGFVVGESWGKLATDTVFLPAHSGPRTYLALAGSPLRLRRGGEGAGLRPGLDVIGGLAGWRRLLGRFRGHGHPRAAARDIRVLAGADGWRMSDRSHVAFVTAAGGAALPALADLLELARYSGAGMLERRAYFQAAQDRQPFGAHQVFRRDCPPPPAGPNVLRLLRRDLLDGLGIRLCDAAAALCSPDFEKRCLELAGDVWCLEPPQGECRNRRDPRQWGG